LRNLDDIAARFEKAASRLEGLVDSAKK
jgi:hypothetical protein